MMPSEPTHLLCATWFNMVTGASHGSGRCPPSLSCLLLPCAAVAITCCVLPSQCGLCRENYGNLGGSSHHCMLEHTSTDSTGDGSGGSSGNDSGGSTGNVSGGSSDSSGCSGEQDAVPVLLVDATRNVQVRACAVPGCMQEPKHGEANARSLPHSHALSPSQSFIFTHPRIV